MSRTLVKRRGLIVVLCVVFGVAIIVSFLAVQSRLNREVIDQANSDSLCHIISGRTHCPTDYVGLNETQATEKAEAANLLVRIVETDGKALPVTMDFSDKRVNFKISSGNVVAADFY